MKTHELKTDPTVFAAVASGIQTHNIRLNDRGFAAGDVLVLRETLHSGAEMEIGAPLIYTGRTVAREVSHVLRGYGLNEGWCILSFAGSGYAAGVEKAARLVEQTIGGARPKELAMAIRALPGGPTVDGEQWTAIPPTEQGEYWHWNGDTSAAPFPLSVLWSGTCSKCFVSMKDAHSELAEWCDTYGGYWLRIRQPSIAGAFMLQQGEAMLTDQCTGQVDPIMALPSRPTAEWGASAGLTPEYKAAQAVKNAGAGAALAQVAVDEREAGQDD